MKRLMQFLCVTILFFLAIGFFGCTDDTSDTSGTTTETPEETSIVGEYIIDITDLGMPLQFYLKIDEDDNFYLSPDRSYEVDKGHGIVGSSK